MTNDAKAFLEFAELKLGEVTRQAYQMEVDLDRARREDARLYYAKNSWHWTLAQRAYLDALRDVASVLGVEKQLRTSAEWNYSRTRLDILLTLSVTTLEQLGQ